VEKHPASVFTVSALLLLLSIVFSALLWKVHPHAPQLYLSALPDESELSAEQIEEQYRGEVFWIDARREELYQRSHREGSINLNPQNIEDKLFEYYEELTEVTSPVVIYCDSRQCQASKKVAEFLRERLPLLKIYTLFQGSR